MYKKIIIGTSLLLLLLGCNQKSKKVECAYASKESHAITTQGVCAELQGEDTLLLYPEHFKKLDFEHENPLTIYVTGEQEPKVFYVSTDGKIAHMLYFDNGADYFEEGLARTVAKNKIGFIDSNLTLIIPAQYDFAFPFKDGKARVCNGCAPEETDDEHQSIVGGKWGLIDKHGVLIEPMK